MSDDSGVFYKLAHSISPEERSDLLERLSARVGETEEPLIPEIPEHKTVETADEYYQRMGLLKKLYLEEKVILLPLDFYSQ